MVAVFSLHLYGHRDDDAGNASSREGIQDSGSTTTSSIYIPTSNWSHGASAKTTFPSENKRGISRKDEKVRGKCKR